MSLKTLCELKPLIIQCVRFAPYKVIASFLLMLASSASSGIGILLIIPLMASIGVDIGGFSPSSGIPQAINGITSSLGITLDLASVLVLYLTIIFIMAAIAFVNTIVATSLRQSFVVHLRNKLARRLFYAEWSYISRAHMSDFVRLLTGQVQTVSSCLYLLLSLANSLILVAVYLGFSLLLSPVLTSIALVCGLALAALLWPINKRIHASGSLGLKANQAIHRSIYENVASLKIIKSFTAEERYLHRMAQSNTTLEAQQVRIAKFNALTRFVNLVGAAVIFTLLFYGAIQWLSLPIANLLVILFIFSRLMPQISSIQGTVQNLFHQAPSYQNLVSHFSELDKWSEHVNENSNVIEFGNELELKNLCYQYTECDTSVLKNLDAKIQHNSTVAIVGPSGVGKSTLADLISGLLLPTSGKILVDGQEINTENRQAWRASVAYVTQEVFLFHETVRENLNWVCAPDRFNSESEAEREMWRVLKLAAADEFVKHLPNGLDTAIGDRGVKLSGGERQRLALARALLTNPEVLILDEATSALDKINELKVRDALVNLKGKQTIIIIAHNEATIEHVSHRIILNPHSEQQG